MSKSNIYRVYLGDARARTVTVRAERILKNSTHLVFVRNGERAAVFRVEDVVGWKLDTEANK